MKLEKLPRLIYAPADIRKVVALLWGRRDDPHAEAALLHVLLGAFAGLRPFEVDHFDWEAIDFDKRQIRLMAPVVKRGRVIPIQENLLSFLIHFKGRQGLVVTQRLVPSLLRGYWKEAGVKPISRGLRVSYGAYRLMKSPTEAVVVQREMGMTPRRYEKQIRRLCTPAAATRYWRIYPSR